MHDCIVRMKDDRKFCGPIWEFKPAEGYLTIPSDPDAPSRIFLRNVAVASTTTRTVHGVEHSKDLLQEARDRGWNGE